VAFDQLWNVLPQHCHDEQNERQDEHKKHDEQDRHRDADVTNEGTPAIQILG
jgi:hypothetical protein